MKVEIEVDDFVEFVSALNNSIVALNDIYNALYLGCEIPLKFEKMLNEKFGLDNHEEKCDLLKRRLDILIKVYTELVKKEME